LDAPVGDADDVGGVAAAKSAMLFAVPQRQAAPS
jgi:hypothetical protein